MLSDPDLKIIRTWGVKQSDRDIAVPCMFLVHSGKVKWRYIGTNATDRTSVDKVLGALDRLGYRPRRTSPTPPPRPPRAR